MSYCLYQCTRRKDLHTKNVHHGLKIRDAVRSDEGGGAKHSLVRNNGPLGPKAAVSNGPMWTGPWAVGFVILIQSLKFIRGQGCSHYFDDADSNGGKSFGITVFLGVANRRRSFDIFFWLQS